MSLQSNWVFSLLGLALLSPPAMALEKAPPPPLMVAPRVTPALPDFADGIGSPPPQPDIATPQSIAHLLDDAQFGDVMAQYQVGRWCVDSADPDQVTVGLAWWQKAADQGYGEASLALAVHALDDKATAPDDGRILNWLDMAAHADYAAAQARLSRLYLDGRRVTRDDVAAYQWLSLAARRPDADDDDKAQIDALAARLSPAQMADATAWLAAWKPAPRTTEQEVSRGLQAYKLNHYTEAATILTPLATAGNARAQFFVGRMYNLGLGAKTDTTVATDWYRKSAEQGYAPAQVSLGFFYYKGVGVTQDYTTAAMWLQKAADQGLLRAYNLVGVSTLDGLGVVRDETAGMVWLQKSAAAGQWVAQFQLGERAMGGPGQAKDYVQAYKWESLAVMYSAGTSTGKLANEDVAFVTARMTADQLAQGKDLVAAWHLIIPAPN